MFRVRAGRIAEQSLLERLSHQGFRVDAVPGLATFYRVVEGPHPVSLTLEHWQGLLYVQQASTGVAAPTLAPTPGERILDLCAAPGGKTTHIAELMHDRGCVVAAEISESRIRGLLGNVYRLCHPNVLTVAADGREFPAGVLFDRTLVDAPCSGEGTLRRRSGRPPEPSRSFLAYVTGAQRALLERAVRLTRPGGVVLYVTCTFAPEENEAVVSDALQRLPVELEPLELAVPHAPGLTRFEGRSYDPRVEGSARIYPHHLDSGGLFLARLRRLEGDAEEVDRGWSSVPTLFPDEPGTTHAAGDERAEGGAKAAADTAAQREAAARDAEDKVRIALSVLDERYGAGRALEDVSWTLRGGRLWMHTAGEWPLPAWEPGRWRAISLGLRAVEFDTRGRPRPTNDLLRWLGDDVCRIDLDDARLEALLERRPVETDVEQRGPITLGYRGASIGRGAVTARGLVSEIPKARARDLLRVLRPAAPRDEDETEGDGESDEIETGEVM